MKRTILWCSHTTLHCTMSDGTIQKKRAADTTTGPVSKKSAKDKFPVTLAKSYDPEKTNVFDGNWCSSVKLDGVRAWWNIETQQLLSRAKKPFTIPKFVHDMLVEVNLPLDGELFAGRGNFATAISTCRKTTSMNPEEWRQNLSFEVFDLIDTGRTFTERLAILKEAINPEHEFLHIVPQIVIDTSEFDLFGLLDELVGRGEEGLMLKRTTDTYSHSRSSGLLKMKKFHDTEVTVTGFVGGKGKHKGVFGAVIVVDQDGNTCKIGSGFTDEQRASPPFKVGDAITMKYFERCKPDKKTGNISYRFPTFLKQKDALEA